MMLFPVVLALQVALHDRHRAHPGDGTAFFRDVRHLVEVALAVLFWTTPIVYELAVPERLPRCCILLSPMSPFVVAYHEALLLSRSGPSADGLADGRRPTPSARSSSALCAGAVRSKIGSRSALVTPVIEAQELSKRFLLRHNAIGRAEGPLPRLFAPVAPAADRGVLGAEERLARDRARAKRWPGRPQRIGQEHVPQADRRHPPADQRPICWSPTATPDRVDDRARRRVSSGADRPRERLPQRGDPRAVAARTIEPSTTQSSTTRGSSTSSTCRSRTTRRACTCGWASPSRRTSIPTSCCSTRSSPSATPISSSSAWRTVKSFHGAGQDDHVRLALVGGGPGHLPPRLRSSTTATCSSTGRWMPR